MEEIVTEFAETEMFLGVDRLPARGASSATETFGWLEAAADRVGMSLWNAGWMLSVHGCFLALLLALLPVFRLPPPHVLSRLRCRCCRCCCCCRRRSMYEIIKMGLIKSKNQIISELSCEWTTLPVDNRPKLVNYLMLTEVWKRLLEWQWLWLLEVWKYCDRCRNSSVGSWWDGLQWAVLRRRRLMASSSVILWWSWAFQCF